MLLCLQVFVVLDGSCVRLQTAYLQFFFDHHKDKWGGGRMLQVILYRFHLVNQIVTL